MTLTTPALLFPALSLLLLAYTNRFLTLASLIRQLNKDQNACFDEKILSQIDNLKKRIILIRNMQFFGIASLFFCVFSMFMLFLKQIFVGEIIFGISLILMLLSLALSLKEILISIEALKIQLSSCEIITQTAKKNTKKK